MAQVFNMPTLGQSMEEGTIVQWFKREGDEVALGDRLVEIMSDKANFEVESEVEGVLRKILVSADGIAAVNTPIAVFGNRDEPIDHLLNGSGVSTPSVTASPSLPAAEPRAEGPATAANSDQPSVHASPRARRAAEDRSIAIEMLAGRGSGVDGRIVEKDVIAYAAERQESPAAESKARVTPLAARIADDLGIDVGDLALGLPGSKITADVIRRHAEDKPAPTATAQSAADAEIAETIALRGMRKIISDNVARSRQTAPHVTLVMEVDMTEASALFKKLAPEIQKTYATKLTYSDLLIKAAAKALEGHPLCNAALIGDEIRVYRSKNIGVAGATETGLVVPVVRSADSKSIGEVSVELKALVERCRTGKQSSGDLSGGTFTITNLGAYGVDSFDPIIMPPQSCILGVCRIAQKPLVVEGQIAVRSTMNLCLSFDHRVLDGAPAAQFLKRLKEVLESPLLIFV
jgi:pyruvate dehydrogenase E2 component (dihydrolipoamide acetyltransferase)